MQPIKKTNTSNDSDQYNLIHWNSDIPQIFSDMDLLECDAIYIDCNQPITGIEVVRTIRTNTNLKISLKPIITSSTSLLPFGFYDAQCEISHFDLLKEEIKKIYSKLVLIPEVTERNLNFEEWLLVRLLSYLYSRGETLEPFPCRYSKFGYYYPYINLFFNYKEEPELLKLIHDWVNSNYISSSFSKKARICSICHNSFLQYDEYCPHCQSIQLNHEELTHHFKCGYVGPISDFKSYDDGLNCPKCDHFLHQIGVDYDKPSYIFQCKACFRNFQQPEVKAICIDCQNLDTLDHLKEIEIPKLSMTTKGKMFISVYNKKK